MRTILDKMSLDWDLSVDRELAYRTSLKNAATFQRWLVDPEEVTDDEIEALGLIRDKQRQQKDIDDFRKAIGNIEGKLGRIEVHSVRPARRVGPDGQTSSDLVVEITQTFRAGDGARYRGGCTLLIDLETGQVRYLIRKRVLSTQRATEQQGLADEYGLSANYFDTGTRRDEPFALLHGEHR